MEVSSDVAFSQDVALSPWERHAISRDAMTERTARRQQHRHSPRGPNRGAVLRSHTLLTRCEREVLRLLTLRLSDPEIGRRLFIGARTVETHVANILDKLGAANRREAAALAAAGGHPLPNQ